MKKSYILMIVAMFCMFATGCKKEEMKTIGRFIVSEQGFDDPDAKMHFTLANGGANGGVSRLCYDDGDAVLINGYNFTLHKTGTVWTAEEQNHEDVTAPRFYCIYSTPNMNISGSGSTYSYSTTFSGSPAVATHNGVLLAGSTEDSLLTLRPACAILRFPADGAQMDYVRVGFTAGTIPTGGSITISDGGVASISPTGYFGGVTTDLNGQFLEMITDPGNGYMSYYVAVPIASNSVNTQLFLTWKYNGVATVYKYKTSSTVTLQRGKVYTIGTSRVSPFNEDGSTKKMFKVGSSKYVYFSCGNLQCQNQPTRKWRFAEHQYDTRDAENVNIDLSYEGWIDLFGWGTSGWNSGANERWPYSSSNVNSDYWPNNDPNQDLTGSYANADWGVRNSDGTRHIYYGNTESSAAWRTLTSAEWDYLFNTRSNAANKWGRATIAGIYKGVIVLPESWTLPSGISFTPGTSSRFTTNEYSLEEWGELEYAGAVFLPVTGYRDETTMYGSGTEGCYWSTTHATNDNAYAYRFTNTLQQRTYGGARHFGYAVRLVKNYVDPDDK